jgi:hypothetical protein
VRVAIRVTFVVLPTRFAILSSQLAQSPSKPQR